MQVDIELDSPDFVRQEGRTGERPLPNPTSGPTRFFYDSPKELLAHVAV
jgi:hypothetical protein